MSVSRLSGALLLCSALFLGACSGSKLYPPEEKQSLSKGSPALRAEPAPAKTEETSESGTSEPEPSALAKSAATPMSAPDLEGGQLESGSDKYPGTDRFVKARSRKAPETEVRDSEVILNFENAELREVVRAILGDTLNVSYVYDPRVQGVVSLKTTRPLPSEIVLETLETLLRMNGAALVAEGEVLKVIPSDEAVRGNVVPELGVGGRPIPPGYAVRILPLRFISAVQMEQLLTPFLPPEGILRVDVDRNLLVLAGTSRELENLIETAELFDVDWLAGMSAGIFPLENVAAEAVAAELEVVFRNAVEGALEGVIQFEPIERLNALLVVTSRSGYLDKAETWIKRLDQGTGTGQNLYVYYLEYGNAADVATILTDLFSGDETQAERGEFGRLAPGRSPVELSSSQDLSAALPDVDEEDPREEVPVSERVGPGPSPGAAARRIEGIAFARGADVRIIADEVNNALLILATPQDYRMVESALRKIDVVPLQVLIEATIAEVELNDELRYGTQWFFKLGDFGLNTSGRGTFSSGASSALQSAFPGFSFVLSEGGETRFILDALEDVTTVNVVSSPQLMVRDNQTAELQVGDEVPVITQQQQSPSDVDAPLVNTVQFRDTGVILRVTPRVSSGGAIILDIEQEVSDVQETTTSGIDSPTISQRKISSSVIIHSGETLILGGLIDESNTRTSSGLPFLARIPFIGWLFGRQERTAERTELIVLLSPRVVRDLEEAREATEEVRKRMEGLKPFQKLGRREPLFDDSE